MIGIASGVLAHPSRWTARRARTAAMGLSWRTVAFASTLLVLLLSARAEAQEANALRIGLLTDMSGANADLSGPGTLEAIRMAVEDYGGKVLGRPIQIVAGDHLNKPDVGLAIARDWYDHGVGVIFDVGLSSIALAVQDLARQSKKIVVFGSTLTSDLTGRACSPYGISWVTDEYAQSKVVATEAVREGQDTWFFLKVDYVLGRNLEQNATNFINQAGGRVLGSIVHPLDLHDASSFLLTAQSSGAKAIGLATTTANARSIIKQADEFNIVSGGQRIFAFNLQERDVQSIGLKVAQGYISSAPFYWDLNDQTRAWAGRFFKRAKVMPNAVHAGMYGAVLHYLKAVAASGSDQSEAVMSEMKRTPIEDVMTQHGTIREDGRVIRDLYILRVKKPADSTGEWDLYDVIGKVPGEAAFRPLADGGCPYVR